MSNNKLDRGDVDLVIIIHLICMQERDIILSVVNFLEKRPVMKKYDTPRNVAKLLRGEVDELNEEILNPALDKTKIKGEIADIAIYLITLSYVMGFNLFDVIKEKTHHNHTRFPENLFQEGEFEEIYLRIKQKLNER